MAAQMLGKLTGWVAMTLGFVNGFVNGPGAAGFAGLKISAVTGACTPGGPGLARSPWMCDMVTVSNGSPLVKTVTLSELPPGFNWKVAVPVAGDPVGGTSWVLVRVAVNWVELAVHPGPSPPGVRLGVAWARTRPWWKPKWWPGASAVFKAAAGSTAGRL